MDEEGFPIWRTFRDQSPGDPNLEFHFDVLFAGQNFDNRVIFAATYVEFHPVNGLAGSLDLCVRSDDAGRGLPRWRARARKRRLSPLVPSGPVCRPSE